MKKRWRHTTPRTAERYALSMKIYTKTGDAGETGLYGGERVPKDALRVSAYGTVDEANAAIGVARSSVNDKTIIETLAALQNALFDVGADLATPSDSKYRSKLTPIDEHDAAHLEGLIDRYEEELEPLQNFILPGGHEAAATLHLARTIVRRAEREVTRLAKEEEVNAHVAIYLNRLSDLLFVMARIMNMKGGVSETRWHVKSRQRGRG